MAEERRGGQNPAFGFAEKNVVPKMYNGSGVIIPKKEGSPPPKKVEPEPVPKKKVQAVTKAPVATGHRPSTDTNTRPVKKIEKSPKKEEKMI